MTIEEMKAKGYKRYTAFIEKHIVTKEVEVWAKGWDDANDILVNVAEKLPDSAFEVCEEPEIVGLGCGRKSPRSIAAAQSIIAKYNEDFYKNEGI